jgi:hypothetical protein
MIEYIQSEPHRLLKIDRELGTVKKIWTGPTATLQSLHQHVALLDVVAPDRVVNFGGKDGLIYITFKYIDGITLRDWFDSVGFNDLSHSHDVWRMVVRYWIDAAVDTFPYAHWDWASCNTIIVDRDPNLFKFEMIDWDKCRKASVDDIKDRLVYRLRREMDGIVQRAPHVIALTHSTLAESLAYFDRRFKGVSC